MSRSRSRREFEEVQGPFYLYLEGSTGTPLGTLTYTYTNFRDKSILDDVTPNYYDIIRDGGFLPINATQIGTNTEELLQPHSGSAVLTPGNPSAVSQHHGSYVSVYHGSFLPVYTPSSSDIDHVVIKALAAAKAPDFDLLTFAAEFGQTVELLQHSYSRFFRLSEKIAYRAFKRERRLSRRQRRDYSSSQALEDFFNLWLEARYGWRPLLYDIQDILKALRHKSSSAIQRRSARHVVPIEVSDTTSGSVDNAVTWQVEKEQVGECSLRAVVFHKSDMSPIGINPLITAWEVTKYSFVVDWFIDIGSWLQAISPRAGYSELGVSVSWVTSYTEVVTTTLGSLGGWTNGYGPQILKRTVKLYNRQAYTGIPIPSIQVNLNKLKVLDLIALVFQHQSKMAGILRL